MRSLRLRRARDYGVGDGEAEGDGEALVSVFFLVEAFSVVVDFFMSSFFMSSFFMVSFFIVDDFFVVVDGAVVVVVADSFLVVHEAMSPAASKTVIE